MLKTLYIKNFALIGELEASFGPGLNIITGETGAGKSVIVDALMLILGERASSELVKSGESKAVIEGKFDLPQAHPVSEILRNEELDIENGELIFRREISAKGNSRCFINDTPVQLSLMKEAGDLLVDFHGQHDHQLLLRRENHCGILDAFAGTGTYLNVYRIEYNKLIDKIREYDALLQKEASLKDKRESYTFELNELSKVNPKPGEDAAISRELAVLENAEKLSGLTLTISNTISGDENPARDYLTAVLRALRELAGIDPQFTDYIEECESAIITFDEIAKFCSNYAESIGLNPEKTEELRLRLSKLMSLRKKYGSLEAAAERQEYLESELKLINNYDSALNEIRENIASQKAIAGEIAGTISRKRKEATREFSSKIVETLAELGIQNTTFSVEIKNEEVPDEFGYISVQAGKKHYRARQNGIDSVEFLISTNAGEAPKPLANVASGGEISRVMLALKSFAAMSESLPMLVFDEIDTGVSGRIALKVAGQMKRLAKRHQIIAITHLPQIAAAGDINLQVTKDETGNRTDISVNTLKHNEKAEEVARLFSGDKITAPALKTARELITSLQ